MQMPRIRARTGKGDDKQWYFEISVWNFEGTQMIGDQPIGTFGPWPTEKKAKQEMRKAVELACKAVKGPEGETPSGYVDFKNGGQFRSFNEH